MILNNTVLSIHGTDGLTSKQLKVLNLFYAPLMEALSFKLYLLLISLNEMVIQIDYKLLTQLLNCSLDELELARIDCEKVVLIKTFASPSSHLIEILSPKTVNELVKHPLLGRLLIQKLGAQHLNLITSFIKENIFDEEYLEEITQTIHLAHLKDFDQKQEDAYQNEIHSFQTDLFDIEMFLLNVNEVLFPKHLRTKDVLETISKVANDYQISVDQMKIYVAKAINNKSTEIDLNYLTKLVSSQIIQITSTDPNPFNWTTNEFIQYKMGDVSVAEGVLKAIDATRKKYKFSDSILNVMINYTIENNRGIITDRYLDMLGSAMLLNKVKTQQDAINHFAFNTTKIKTKKQKTTIKRQQPKEITESPDKDEQNVELKKVLDTWK